MTIDNIAIKATKAEILDSYKGGGYIWESGDGWVLLFSDEMMEVFKTAQNLSEQAKTIATAALVYDSDQLVFAVYDNGKVAFQYTRDEENLVGTIDVGDVAALVRLFPTTSEDTINEILSAEEVFIEDKYRKLLSELQLPKALGDWGFDYINDADETDELLKQDLPNIQKL